MAEPSSSSLDDLKRRLDACSWQIGEELGKRPVSDTRVAQYQKYADILLEQIRLASGEVQHHDVYAVLSDILGLMPASSHRRDLQVTCPRMAVCSICECNCRAACHGQGHCGSHVLTVVRSTGEVLLKGQPPAASTNTVCELGKACSSVRGETSVTDVTEVGP